MESLVGSFAITICKLRQARKGATVAVLLCAGVWLARLSTLYILFRLSITSLFLHSHSLFFDELESASVYLFS
jgi:hypothetical protein